MMSSEFDSWWAQWPDRRQNELAAFARHGAHTSILHEKKGLLILEVSWPVSGEEPMTLSVGFSFLHPFFRPDISAPDQSFGRHQNPLTKGLCLVAQGEDQWDANELVADMIDRQLKKLIGVIEARDQKDFVSAAANEEVIADPLSIYFNGLGERLSAAYFDTNVAVPGDPIGTAEAVVQSRQAQTDDGNEAVEIILHRFNRLGSPWLAPSFDLPQRVVAWSKLPARWARISPLKCKNADDLLKRASEGSAGARQLTGRALAAWLATERGKAWLTILVIEDDADYEGQAKRPGLIFVMSRRVGKRVRNHVIRSYGVADDMFDRLPLRAALRAKTALLVGCGAIGSFVALELARAGFGRVILVDPDLVEPANYVRWPMGRLAWGIPKASALAAMISQHFPWTKASAIPARVGAAESNVEQLSDVQGNPFLDIQRTIADADVIIDATASSECQQAMSYYAKMAGKPLVIGNGTLGAAGGIVAQFGDKSSACFNCARQQWLKNSLPQPAVDPEGKLVPVGCNAETFRGGSYDLQEISLQMMRSAVGLVLPEEFDGGDWDVAVLSHFKDGARALPTWEMAEVQPALACCFVPAAA